VVEEKNMKRTLLFSTLALTLPAAHGENLLDVYRLAQQHDLTLAQSVAGAKAGMERHAQGRAQLLPTLNYSATRYDVAQEVRQPITDRYYYETQSRLLELKQPLFRMQNFAQYRQGKAQAAQAEMDVAVAQGELMIRAAETYFNVLAAEDALTLARTEKAAIAGQLALAQRNFSVGSASVVDVHEARARHDLAVAQEVSAETDLQVKRELLAVMINTQPAALARLGAKLDLAAPEPNDIEAWNRLGQERSPLIVLYERALAVAEEEVARQRGAHYPALDFVATHGYNRSENVYTVPPTPNESHTSQAGLQLNVPLYAGGITSSRTREAEARREQARAALDQTRRTTTRQTREAFLAVTSGMARVQALDAARTSGKRSLESTLIGYESGVRTGVDVLNAQQSLYRTERDLSQARYAYLLNHLRLKLVTGVLSTDDLAAVNALLTDS
jgi:outer membrane protein